MRTIRTLVSVATVAAMVLGVSACGGEKGRHGETSTGAGSSATPAAPDLAVTRAGADELADITPATASTFSCEALASYDGIYLGDNSKVTQFFRSMPTGGSMDTFEIKGDEGVLRVVYLAPETLPELEALNATLQAMADCGREHVQNLETVEFVIPDQHGDGLTYTK